MSPPIKLAKIYGRQFLAAVSFLAYYQRLLTCVPRVKNSFFGVETMTTHPPKLLRLLSGLIVLLMIASVAIAQPVAS
jgi:hypothetical protein